MQREWIVQEKGKRESNAQLELMESVCDLQYVTSNSYTHMQRASEMSRAHAEKGKDFIWDRLEDNLDHLGQVGGLQCRLHGGSCFVMGTWRSSP